MKNSRLAVSLAIILVCILSIAYPLSTTTLSILANTNEPPARTTSTTTNTTISRTSSTQFPTSSGSTTQFSPVSLSVSFGVVGGGNASGPWFEYVDGGVSRNDTLVESPTTLKVDSGTRWYVASVLFGGVAGERWLISAGNATTGTATVNMNLEFTYYHQFLLTILADPANGGSTESTLGKDNWENSSSPVTIRAIPNPGFAFDGWSCEGNGCYSGSNNPARVTMNGPVTETAHFRQTAKVLIEALGGSQFIIVDNNTKATEISTGPFDPNWGVNSTHTLVALSKASCGLAIGPFSGCVYVFKQWIVNGVPQPPGDTLQIRVTGKPVTIIGVWEPSYQNLEIAILLAAGIAAVILLLRLKRPRPLPGAGPVPPRGLLYRVGLLTDVGKVRTNNEDSIVAVEMAATFGSKSTSVLLCAVADGVGGARKGEVASTLALQTVIAETSLDMISSRAELGEVLRRSVEAANTAVVNYGMEHRESEGLATTIVASIIERGMAYVAHAGDSRAYLLNRAGIRQLTKDDSQVQQLVDAGTITPDQARHYPGRNVITRAVGAASDIQVSSMSIVLQSGDRILLCSDGLWEPVSDIEIHKVVMQSPDPQSACKQLISLSNQRGGRDNVSVIIVELQSPRE